MTTETFQFKFENLGPLATGTIELANLTVICGENNTGKTYLTHTLYGLLQTLGSLITLPEFDIKSLREYGAIEIDLERSIMTQVHGIVQNATRTYCENLHRVLAAQEPRFDETHLELVLNFDGVLKKEYQNRFSSDRNRRILSFEKPENSSVLTISAASEEPRDARSRTQYKNLIDTVITEICFSPVIPEPFMVSTERTGAVMFQSELNLAKNRLIDLASEVSDKRTTFTPTQLLERFYRNGYSMPVRDNVEFINSLSNIQTQESELLKTEPGILDDFEELIGGTYSMRSNVLYFVPKGTRGVRLQMSESSSAVRSLVILGYYLKHRATKGDLLMIDEPELNLHPTNQRRLARLLARLVNAGIKVAISTHSDYIVKEFNTLIMLNRDVSNLDEIRHKWGYTVQDRLAPEAVRVYVLRDDLVKRAGKSRKSKVPTICRADISPSLGIEVSSFDETIDTMNSIQEEIYYAGIL